jgi:hypothetical protein
MDTLPLKMIVIIINILINIIATLFVAIYALFNIYMYVIAYLYSPNLDSLEEL